MEHVALKELAEYRGDFTDEGRERLAVATVKPEDTTYTCHDLQVLVPKGSNEAWLAAGKTVIAPLTEPGLSDLASLVGAPFGYLRRCDAQLVAQNTNRWLRDEHNDDRSLLIRLKEQSVYGVASAMYAPIDHARLIEVVEAATRDDFDLDLRAWEVTGKKMTIAVSTRLTAEPRIGDLVRYELRLQNSENGFCSLGYRSEILRLVCTNGATIVEAGAGRHWKHLGRDGEAMFYDFTEAIKIASREGAKYLTSIVALPQYTVDVAKVFDKICREDRLVPKKYLEQLVGAFADDEHGADSTLWGVYNAVTRVGRDAQSQGARELFAQVAGQIAANPERFALN